jgi:hypothetical protein
VAGRAGAELALARGGIGGREGSLELAMRSSGVASASASPPASSTGMM